MADFGKLVRVGGDVSDKFLHGQGEEGFKFRGLSGGVDAGFGQLVIDYCLGDLDGSVVGFQL